MLIKLTPQRRDDTLSVSVAGDVVTVNGEAFDFGPLPEGATLPQDAIDSDWFAGPVTRENGTLTLTLLLPHGANPSLNVAFPSAIVKTGDGPVTLPVDTNPKPQDMPEAIDEQD